MINTLIKAISIALDAEFQEKEYGIHAEIIKQDLEEPCFFISCINPTRKLFFGKRYFMQNQFVIQYFPESEEDLQSECNAVAERMFECLECIADTTGEVFRGTKMNYQVIDDVLNFFVNYDCFVYRVEQEVSMESMEAKEMVKEDKQVGG